MRIDILTVVPELLESPLQHSIVGRAQQQGFLELYVHNIRDYATNKWRRVDDYPFGGEAGMILQIEPIDRAIADLKSQRHYDEVIYTSPDGETFDQGIANQMSLQENLIILCGHYKGIVILSPLEQPIRYRKSHDPRYTGIGHYNRFGSNS